jgi:hypothetical protein
LPAPDIQRVHYGKSFPAERLQMLQYACQVARQHAEQQGIKYKAIFDKSSAPQHCANLQTRNCHRSPETED